MKLNKNIIIDQIQGEFVRHSSDTLQILIDHFSYSIADIESWDELTETEKQIIPKELFNKFVS